ncbi:hypothetical protein BC835DRAFT_82757 [Cytidiella melzeri]|nr:hypothetical protein BC835DRAFT_82757 [Cytidiella melzeri]
MLFTITIPKSSGLHPRLALYISSAWLMMMLPRNAQGLALTGNLLCASSTMNSWETCIMHMSCSYCTTWQTRMIVATTRRRRRLMNLSRERQSLSSKCDAAKRNTTSQVKHSHRYMGLSLA